MGNISFGVIINNFLYTRDHFESMKHNDQVDTLVEWFTEHFQQVSWDDRLLFDAVQHSEVEVYDELISVFLNYVSDEVIDDAVDKITPEGDDIIWVPIFDDSMYWSDDEHDLDSYEVFQASIDRIIEMKSKAHMLGGDDFQQHLFQILYANIFTSFEAYMVRAFINKLFESNETLELYLSKQKEFKFDNPRLVDLLKGHVHIEQLMEKQRKEIKVKLAKASWHDLDEVPTRFHCIGIDLKLSSSGLYSIIQKRNDIVHRNGRTIDDDVVIITDADLKDAILVVVMIAHTIRGHELGFENLNEKGNE